MKRTLLSINAIIISASVAFGQTQLPNVGFEDWETLNGPISNTYQEPDDWNTSNQCTAIINQFSVTQSNDANTGSYSARLETRSTSFQGIIANGVMTTAQMICLAQGGGQEGGMPFTTQLPDSIVGWFKYAPVGSDSAYAQLMFLAGTNDEDTVSMTRVNFHAAANWTRFSAAVNPASSAPAKLSLILNSSWGDGSQGQAVVGSVFHVDDVQLIYPIDISVGDEHTAANWSVYPNPVKDILQVRSMKSEHAMMEILDVTGKQIKQVNLNGEFTNVDLGELVAGVYLYQIRSMNGDVFRTGKLLVNP